MTARRVVPIAIGVLAVLLAGLAALAAIMGDRAGDEADRLRAEADRVAARAGALTAAEDAGNIALTDPAATTQVAGALRELLERVLSYDYRDLDRTAAAVRESLDGPAVCQYEALYAEVRRLAAEQRITMVSQVSEVGVRRLTGDTAAALVFVDQRVSRAQGEPAASGAQFGVEARRVDGRWKVTNFDLLTQPMPGGTPPPAC